MKLQQSLSEKMHRLSKLLPVFGLALLVIIFFGKTLTGQEFFVTPDFSSSDILMAEYPPRFFLSESLKNHQLPLWTNQISTGFPIASITLGFFNPINAALFYFLPSALAFNWSLALSYFAVAIFTYLFARSINLSKPASFLAASTFTLSGTLTTQIVHLTIIQALSYFPAEMYLLEIYLQRKKPLVLILLSFTIGLQILAGFYQIILYSLIFMIIYLAGRIVFEKKPRIKLKIVIPIFLAILASFATAAVQLLPTWEFTQISTRASSVTDEEMKLFPYPPKHLITLIKPYFFGDPRTGTYPLPSASWGLFGENTTYIGILPLILAVLALIRGRKNPKVIIMATLGLLCLLLMLGKNSPLTLLFNIPPLSLFRVPARWIIFFTFSLSILAGFGLDILQKKFKKTAIILAILAITTIDCLNFSAKYNLRGPTSEWLAQTQTANFLKKDTSLFRIDGGGTSLLWNSKLNSTGWRTDSGYFLKLLDSQDPNWNITQNLEHVDSYPIIKTQREKTLSNLRNSDLTQTKTGFEMGHVSRNVLDVENVKYIISPYEISARDLELVFQTSTEPRFSVYQNKTVLPRTFVATNWQVIQNANQYQTLLALETFDPKTTVVLEKDLSHLPFKSKNTSTKITKYENRVVEAEVETDSGGIFVISDSFYPGWKARVDGKEVEILAANINQRAIVVESGKHQIRFSYEPQSFKQGAIISIASTIFLLSLLTSLLLRKRP